MPRSSPHPFALFSLSPIAGNERAKDVINHPRNSQFISTLPDGSLALDIGFNIRSQFPTTLATLGRSEAADICLQGARIARIQCCFEIDLDTGVIMLHDKSTSQTTQVYGANSMPFEHGRPRRILVQPDFNTIIGMGGVGRNLVMFELVWHSSATQTIAAAKDLGMLAGQAEQDHLAPTADHTPGSTQLGMRHVIKEGNRIGSGSYGVVYKTIDVDSGRFMAVKVIKQPAILYTLKREVETLSNISHPHIIDYIDSQGWDGPQVEIFMGLKEGTLESMIANGLSVLGLVDRVASHILQALDYLANEDIIHRDVKPENILYTSQGGGQYHFQLGDFGLCNRANNAITFAGSQIYMAPEMFSGGFQTTKLDVWSLFVTLVWALDFEGFRQKCHQFENRTEIQEAVLSAALDNQFSKAQEMAIIDPVWRASAAQMLIKGYQGEGLTTPRHQIPALNIPILQ